MIKFNLSAQIKLSRRDKNGVANNVMSNLKLSLKFNSTKS